jgi:hypothetical protein
MMVLVVFCGGFFEAVYAGGASVAMVILSGSPPFYERLKGQERAPCRGEEAS